MIKAGHLRRYIKEIDQGEEPRQVADKITVSAVAPPESRPAINYILGSPSNYQYQSKSQQKKLLRAATIKARVNAIHTEGSNVETKPIDGPISFPPVNPNRVIMAHYDALVLTLFINGFDVQRVLVDPGSEADLLQLQVGLVTSRAEPNFEHFELGLLIYERARARAELLNELKIRLKLVLI